MIVECLVRYGTIPEVARCRSDTLELRRGEAVVMESQRGQQLGVVVEVLKPSRSMTPVDSDEARDDASAGFTVIRSATESDHNRHAELRVEAESEFGDWVNRIADWNVDVQLVDLEWTLDRTKRVLYVLNDRGPECTKLAIQAAAAGLGIIDVQPVAAEGLVSQPSGGGGCGSGGCGCHN